MRSSRRGRFLVILLGGLVLVILGGAACFWKDLLRSYHLGRLRRDARYVIEIADGPDHSVKALAVRDWLRESEGYEAFLNVVIDVSCERVLRDEDAGPGVVDAFRRGRFKQACFWLAKKEDDEARVFLELTDFRGQTRGASATAETPSLAPLFDVLGKPGVAGWRPLELRGCPMHVGRTTRGPEFAGERGPNFVFDTMGMGRGPRQPPPARDPVERGQLTILPPLRDNPYFAEMLETDPLSHRALLTHLKGRGARDLVLDLIRGMLRSTDSQTRIDGVHATLTYPEERAEWMSRLIAALEDPDAGVRRAAARILASWVSLETRFAIAPLVRVLDDSDGGAREWAATAIGTIGHTTDDVVKGLIAALADLAYRVRFRAAQSLGELDPPPYEAIPALERAITDTHALVRRHATISLHHLKRQ